MSFYSFPRIRLSRLLNAVLINSYFEQLIVKRISSSIEDLLIKIAYLEVEFHLMTIDFFRFSQTLIGQLLLDQAVQLMQEAIKLRYLGIKSISMECISRSTKFN